MQTWDASTYDQQFGVITRFGAPLLDLLTIRAGDRVLDVGCGTGHQAAELLARGASVVGIDADTEMITRARSLHPAVRFEVMDAQQLASDPALFPGDCDAVLSNAALHWMPDQDAVIAGIRSALRTGGAFVAEMGGAGNIDAVRGIVTTAREELGLDPGPPSPWTFPTLAEQVARLDRSGFDITFAHLFARPTPLQQGDRCSAWLRVFAVGLLADIPVPARASFDQRCDQLADERGLVDPTTGITTLDYVRLRWSAIAR